MVKYRVIHRLSPERRKEKEDEERWANAIKERDSWACVICGSKYKPNAHHLIPRELREFKFDLNNGMTLCIKHHKFSREMSAHNNPLAFWLWVEKFNPARYEWAVSKTREMLKGKVDL